MFVTMELVRISGFQLLKPAVLQFFLVIKSGIYIFIHPIYIVLFLSSVSGESDYISKSNLMCQFNGNVSSTCYAVQQQVAYSTVKASDNRIIPQKIRGRKIYILFLITENQKWREDLILK